MRIGFQVFWDNAGLLCALNLAWFALAVLMGWVAALFAPRTAALPQMVILLVAALAVMGGLAAGPAWALAIRLRLDPIGLADVLQGIRILGLRYTVVTLAAALLVGEALFYSRWLATSIPILCPLPLYVAAFWLAALPYQYALLALENQPLGKTIRRACLLALDNPLFSLGTAFLSAIAVLALVVTGVGLGLVAMSMALALSQASTVEVMRKYRINPDYDSWYPDFSDDSGDSKSTGHSRAPGADGGFGFPGSLSQLIGSRNARVPADD